ncbi:MAG: M20/M25/M40 family metallo-hydrolase, partial [Clostridiales bacterium]|nr:M20/M25/M40 family metallo-hydrolase [Clostridiales bacterium]
GHASTPAKPTALASIGKAVYDIEKHQMPAVWTAPTKELIKELAPYMKPLFKFVIVNRDILSPLLKFALTKLHPVAAALVKTTFAPTMAKGSNAANVLPPYAEAVINCRLIDGNTTDRVVAHIKKIVGKDIEVEVPLTGVEPSPISPTNTDSYKQISGVIKSVFPDIKVAPYMFFAATDSRYFYPICKNVYRFTPFKVTEEEQSRVHALNERCDIDALEKATEFFIALIEKTCM